MYDVKTVLCTHEDEKWSTKIMKPQLSESELK